VVGDGEEGMRTEPEGLVDAEAGGVKAGSPGPTVAGDGGWDG